MGYVAMKLAIEPGVDGSVSEESETEWNEDIEEPWACLPLMGMLTDSGVLGPSGLGRGG